MTYAQLLNLISLTIGFLSSLCFAWGSTFTTAKKIISQTEARWDGNKADTNSRIEQSAQYLIGSILLLIYFLLSIVSTQASTEVIQCFYMANVSWFCVVGVSFAVISVPTYIAISYVTKFRKSKLEKEKN